MTEFADTLIAIAGKKAVLTGDRKTEFYRTGFRSGKGAAIAVVFPSTLLQLWQLLKTCVAHNKIIIMQAANTGLTEGSTPSSNDYQREVVIINTTRITKIIVLDQGRQIVSLSGATLHALEKTLKPFGRSPHSVIGSSCIGASIVGGIANNSGGALVKRGPAYTELSLFARCDAAGNLELVNHLGVELGDTPEQIIDNLESESFSAESIKYDSAPASDINYEQRLRAIDENTPARYNADTGRLFEASGCAGKLAVFAVRLDTFPVAKEEQVFYLGTNNPAQLTRLRRDILSQFAHLPETAEYMHRDCFNVAERYGKDTFLLINYLGTRFMPRLFSIKGAIDAYLNKINWLPNHLVDRLMQGAASLWPQHIPTRLRAYRDRYEHHLILKMSDEGIGEATQYLEQHYGNNPHDSEIEYIHCTADEAKKAYLLRFAAAGAAIRYQQMQSKRVGEVLALDIALKRNEINWLEMLPETIKNKIDKSLYYGHFLCHVFHQDYVLKKGADQNEVKQAMLACLEKRSAKYPAEHNVGHLYQAEEGLAAFYAQLDPSETFNPGIGRLSGS